MSGKGWFNLESAASTCYFEGESAFAKLGLSRTTRLYGFAGCTFIGFVLSLLGTIFFSQLKLMFKPVRVVATVILIASIAMIFVGAFVIGSGVLLVIVQFLAYIWYTLSYIPYARTAILAFVKR
ncbi:SFT2-domain-containing protein [Phellopilus nigrolimitatus]|nr:SFT2-domain-containing protein [Phellopilus nigrolimitatus]